MNANCTALCDNPDLICQGEASVLATSLFWVGVGVARFIANFSLLFTHPFASWVMAVASDHVDYFVWISGNHSFDRVFYNILDKIFDTTFYVAVALYLFYWWRELWYGRWIVFWFVYRIAGNILFMAFGGTMRVFQVIFPNVGETLFIIYTFLDVIRVDRRIEHNLGANIGITIGAVVWQLGSEFLRHISKLADEGDSHYACITVVEIGPALFFALVYTFIAAFIFGYYRLPHFKEGTVKRSKSGIFVPVLFKSP